MSISAINARNQIKGIVKHIQLGDAVSEIELDTPAGVITSVITTSSLMNLDLRIGAEAIAVVKATEVALVKPTG
ncbi:MAG: TOBE domain-containing protein [Proteobacteria bacterium]|nr:TOBE domain-containing protein [Pseudomonadota bacterium]